jgi:hypothetical protein
MNYRRLLPCVTMTALLMAGCTRHNAYLDAASIAEPAFIELHPAHPNVETQTITVQRPILPFFGGTEETGQPSIAETAAASLARIGADAVPQLIAALKDHEPEVRAASAKALALMGPKASSAVPALIDALNDSDENVRRTAARALGQIGPAAHDAIPALVELLKHPDSGPAKKATTPPKTTTTPKPTPATPTSSMSAPKLP